MKLESHFMMILNDLYNTTYPLPEYEASVGTDLSFKLSECFGYELKTTSNVIDKITFTICCTRKWHVSNSAQLPH